MAKRAQLGDNIQLQDVMSRKIGSTRMAASEAVPEQPPEPAPIAEAAPVPEITAPPPAEPVRASERVQIIVRMSVSERKALKQIALDYDTTAQSLAEDAIRDVLRRHGYSY